MSWREVTLEDLIDLHDHRRIPLSGVEREKRQGKYRYYGAQGVIDHIDAFIFDGQYVLVAEDGENLRSRKQPIAQIVSGKFWVNNHAHILTGKEGISNNDFVCALLNWLDLGPYITGAAQPKLSQGSLKAVKVTAPDAKTQAQIAAVLSGYSDLIATNKRRISLLEEATRRLYGEWFVLLRFPGHELAKVTNGVPEGWKKLPLTDVADFINGFAFKPEHLQDTGLPIVKIPELRDGITSKTPYNPGSIVPPRSHIGTGDVLFSWSATLLVNEWGEGPALLNQHLFKVVPKNELHKRLVRFAVEAAIPQLLGQSVGATMQHIRRSALDDHLMLVPDDATAQAFAAQVDPMMDAVLTMKAQIKALAQARDALLPKLMSGKLDVSNVSVQDIAEVA